jgi:membrane protein DedA with SNARE-associated domain
MPAGFPAFLQILSDQQLLLALSLFGATFVAEDAATVAAGVLVARTGVDPIAAVSAVILGTATGDLALYGFGRWGKGTQLGQKLRRRSDVRRAESWIAGRVLALVFAARFVPGCRLPIFAASGLVGAPFIPVAAIICLTTPLWTGALFLLARSAGEASAQGLIQVAFPTGLTLIAATFFFWRAVPISRATILQTP